jgi:hypothetical protein
MTSRGYIIVINKKEFPATAKAVFALGFYEASH